MKRKYNLTDKGNKHESLREKAKREPGVVIVYVLLRIIVFAVMILQFFNRNYENVFLCILTLVLFMIPSFVERRLKVDIPSTLEIIILVFIFSAEILGEISAYYTRYKGWDTALHTVTGFLMAAIGFSLVEILNRSSKKVSLSPFFVCIFSLSFSMLIGVVWEFFECTADYLLFTDMQKDTVVNAIHSVSLDPENLNRVFHVWNIGDVVINGEALALGGYLDIGLYDTMKDLAVTFLGSIIFSFFGYFYLTGKSSGSFLRRFMPTRMDGEGEKGEEEK